jgi:hypothetical protein
MLRSLLSRDDPEGVTIARDTHDIHSLNPLPKAAEADTQFEISIRVTSLPQIAVSTAQAEITCS